MSEANQRKDKLLGQPHGTAAAKLRKVLLFKYVQIAGADICYRCQRTIKSIDELSIEHKVAWQSASDPVTAFFDPDNVAFAHLSCNVGARVFPGHHGNRRVGLSGTEWCGTCRAFKLASEFTDNASRWNGKQSECRSCRSRTR